MMIVGEENIYQLGQWHHPTKGEHPRYKLPHEKILYIVLQHLQHFFIWLLGDCIVPGHWFCPWSFVVCTPFETHRAFLGESIPPEKTHQTLKWCGRWLGSHSVFGILGVIVTTRLSRHHPFFFPASAQLQSFEIPNTREPVTFWEKKSYCMHSVVNKIEKGGGGKITARVRPHHMLDADLEKASKNRYNELSKDDGVGKKKLKVIIENENRRMWRCDSVKTLSHVLGD